MNFRLDPTSASNCCQLSSTFGAVFGAEQTMVPLVSQPVHPAQARPCVVYMTGCVLLNLALAALTVFATWTCARRPRGKSPGIHGCVWLQRDHSPTSSRLPRGPELVAGFQNRRGCCRRLSLPRNDRAYSLSIRYPRPAKRRSGTDHPDLLRNATLLVVYGVFLDGESAGEHPHAASACWRPMDESGGT